MGTRYLQGRTKHLQDQLQSAQSKLASLPTSLSPPQAPANHLIDPTNLIPKQDLFIIEDPATSTQKTRRSTFWYQLPKDEAGWTAARHATKLATEEQLVATYLILTRSPSQPYSLDVKKEVDNAQSALGILKDYSIFAKEWVLNKHYATQIANISTML